MMNAHNERIEHVVGWLVRKRDELRAAADLPRDLQDALVGMMGLICPLDDNIAASESAATCSAASGRQHERDVIVEDTHGAPPLVEWRRTSRGEDLPDVWVASTQERLFDDEQGREGFVWLETKDGRRVLHCVRCGYYWTPRDSTEEPKKCARCRSYYWNTPRTYQLQTKPQERPMLKRSSKSNMSGKVQEEN